MHIPSGQLLGRLALAEAGLWATRVNDGQKLVFVVKAPTETLKWIHRGAGVELVIGHVQLQSQCIRCIGLQIADSTHDPLLLSGPQVEPEEVSTFDDLLASQSFTVHFHNENPFASVLDAIALVEPTALRGYMAKRAGVDFYTSPLPTDLFRQAQETFELACLKSNAGPAASLSLFRLPIHLEHLAWNGLGVVGGKTFEPWNSDEGGGQEALLFQLLEPHFQGRVILNPKIPDGTDTRELCDTLALSDHFAFVFESKAFSVLGKSFDQSPERRAKTIAGHFEKAAGQLEGALRRLDDGVSLVSDGSELGPIRANQFSDIHCIVVVSSTEWSLPWDDIGIRLRDLCRPNRFFHFLPLMELQRMVAFALGDPEKIHRMLERRAEVVCESGNANVHSEYVPEPSKQCVMPAVPADNIGLRFAIDGKATTVDTVTAILNTLEAVLRRHSFSGRCEVRHEVGKHDGKAVYWLGIAIGGTGETDFKPDKIWWDSIFKELMGALRSQSLPIAVFGTARLSRSRKLREDFQDLFMVTEFHQGRVSARTLDG